MAAYTLQETVLQTAIFPQPKCHLLLADPAAIKVRPLDLESSRAPLALPCIGGHKLSCKISKAGTSIRNIDPFWTEHRVFGRR